MKFDLATILEILKEINILLGHLHDLGLKVNGDVDLASLIGFIKR